MLITGLSKKRELRSQQVMMRKIIKRYERQINRELNRAWRQAGRSYGKPMWKSEVQAKHVEKIGAILTKLWNQSGSAAVERMFTVVKSLKAEMETKQDEFDIEAPTMNAAVSNWIRLHGGRAITEVSTTTMNNIQAAIAKGTAEGLSESAIGSFVANVAPTKTIGRSQTIARTETHRATQGIAVDVAKTSSIKMEKMWITSIDDRTRTGEDPLYPYDHEKMDGVTVAMDEDFDVDGDRIQYPGDPQGAAANVINCRCVSAFVLPDSL